MDPNEIMEPQAFTDITNQIVEAKDDQAKVTSLLTQLQQGYSTLFATHASVSQERDNLTKKNTELLQANHDLFMERGAFLQQQAERGMGVESAPAEKKRAETIKVADLFKKKEE